MKKYGTTPITLQVPSNAHTGLGSAQDPAWQEHVAASPFPKQIGVVSGQTPLRLPQTHLPSTHRLLSPSHSTLAQGSKVVTRDILLSNIRLKYLKISSNMFLVLNILYLPWRTITSIGASVVVVVVGSV